MRVLLISAIISVLFIACSEDSPTDPGSDVTPEPPYTTKITFNARVTSTDGEIAFEDVRSWVKGVERNAIMRTDYRPQKTSPIWIGIENPYGDGGWMILEGWAIPGGYDFDCTYAGQTVNRKFYK